MRRTSAASAAVVIALVGLSAGCGDDSDDSDDQASDSDGDYCADLPEYFLLMTATMDTGTTDTSRFDDWAAKAEDMAGIAPDELQDHWNFIVDYSGRMAEAGGDISALEPNDVEQNGEAGNAIIEHGQETCEVAADQ